LYARLFRLWRKFQGRTIAQEQLASRSIRFEMNWFALAKEHLDREDPGGV